MTDKTIRVGEPHKHTEWRWFPLDDLPKNIFFPSTKLLAHYVELKKGLQKRAKKIGGKT